MNILSINFNHDGAAALVQNGEVAGFVNTERRSRRKKHPGSRATDVQEVLDQAGIVIDDVDLLQCVNLNTMDSPDVVSLHGTDLKETWPDFWINGSFTEARLFDRRLKCRVEHAHHFFHAALAYFYSPFDSAVSVACDPVGAQAVLFRGGRVVTIRSLSLVAPAVYAAISAQLFGSALLGAGKLMGLAPYGDTGMAPPDFATLRTETVPRATQILTAASSGGIIYRDGDAAWNATLAHYAQQFLEYELTFVLDELYQQAHTAGVEFNLCLSGGTALNSTANQRCFSSSLFRELYLHPACGDDGMPLGAALSHWHLALGQPRRRRSNRDAMYSCRSYDHALHSAFSQYRNEISIEQVSDDLARTAKLIAAGEVVGWFQGASEIGPRALGNRSILADPRSATMKEYLNRAVKQREGFRPFAPSILRSHAREWFGIDESPFMLRVARVASSAVPAVTHVDGTARFQTVRSEDNARFHGLIEQFFELTGVPLVLNTSFNGKGEPIVETPSDAIECMLRNNLHATVFPGYLVRPARIAPEPEPEL